jgi:hypothetical protein
MRPFVENKLKGKKLLTMAHMGGAAHGIENRCATIQACLPFKPDIIEIDVRKSSDGILFCHHGSIPFGVTFWTLFPSLPFSWVRRIVPGVNTLKEVADIIPENTMIYIDIKDLRIDGKDVEKELINCRAGAIWIAPWSTCHLKKLRYFLGDQYIYVVNRPALFLDHSIRNYGNIADVFQVFVWNFNFKTIKKIRENGYGYHLSRWFIGSKKRYALQSKYGDLWVTYNSLARTHKVIC